MFNTGSTDQHTCLERLSALLYAYLEEINEALVLPTPNGLKPSPSSPQHEHGTGTALFS